MIADVVARMVGWWVFELPMILAQLLPVAGAA